MGQVGSGRGRLLSRAFVGLADTLVDDYDIIDLLDRLVSYSVELLAADAAGIMLADSQGNLRVVASSQEDAKVMELLQLQSEQGPCMECCRTGAPVSVPNLADAATRWPVFVAAVAERRAYRSVHALPLRLRGEAIGAMNLFHGQFEARSSVLQNLRLDEDIAKVISHHPRGAMFGWIDANDGEMFSSDFLNTRADDTIRFLQRFDAARLGLGTFTADTAYVIGHLDTPSWGKERL